MLEDEENFDLNDVSVADKKRFSVIVKENQVLNPFLKGKQTSKEFSQKTDNAITKLSG